MNTCDYCRRTTLAKIVGTVSISTKKDLLNISVKSSKAKNLRDNQFEFYLRRGGEEFKFCSVPCLSNYMGYGGE